MFFQARTEPTDDPELIEYLLNTDMVDMQYEVTRFRPRLTAEFFSQLDKTIGEERFQTEPDEDRLAELDSLRAYLEVINGALSPMKLVFRRR